MSPASRGLAPMRRLAHLVGDWEGSGWALVHEDQVRTFHQTETVRAHLDGELLTLEGHGVDDATGRDAHRAIAVLTFDRTTSRYRWDAYVSGERTSTRLVVDDAGFTWSMTRRHPLATTDFRVEVDHTTWSETGQLSHDGTTRTTVLEMTLHRRP